MFDVSFFSHTNRVYSDSLRVTAATVDNSRSLYVLYRPSFNKDHCIWSVSIPLCLNFEWTLYYPWLYINKRFHQYAWLCTVEKKKDFYSFLWRLCVFFSSVLLRFVFMRRKVNKIHSNAPHFFFIERVHWYAWWNPTNIDSAKLKTRTPKYVSQYLQMEADK